MLVPLVDAVARSCGGKAGALGQLSRAGLHVPDGVVVPFAAYRGAVRDLDLERLVGDPGGLDAARLAIRGARLPGGLRDELARWLVVIGDAPVAVRSSAGNEDTVRTSAAGQHESVLAVRGVDAVVDAVRACWASLWSDTAVAYREASPPGQPGEPVMGVLVQRHVDAQVSGVMFTPGAPEGVTVIEASWGLGATVVGGTGAPDAYRVALDGSVTVQVAAKVTRLDRNGARLVTTDVPEADRRRPTLGAATARRLAGVGRRVAAALGGAQDVEWAIVDGDAWIVQARPVTSELPAPSLLSAVDHAPATLTGTPGSSGAATGAARVVRGPGDFSRVRPGDILVCPWTDPGWTPLLGIVAGVVTETGGVLSHAAIVARERGIPAVLGVPGATTKLPDAATVTIDGAAGTVRRTHEEEG